MTALPVYLGIDIAKNSLQCSLLQRSFTVSNDAKGMASLTRHLDRYLTPQQRALLHAVCEATGTYQNCVVDFFHQHQLPISVVNPRQVRDFARSRGTLEKTDSVDALGLVRYAQANTPPPTPPQPEHLKTLEALINHHAYLVSRRARDKTRLSSLTDSYCRARLEESILFDTQQINKVEADLKTLRDQTAEIKTVAERLQQAPGIGMLSALTLTALLPELGSTNRRAIAKLAGLAPLNRDSGNFRGQRRICAGRPRVRLTLYRASVSCIRHYPSYRAVYDTLKASGKSSKCALIAIARKLLLTLNAMIKNPHFSLAL